MRYLNVLASLLFLLGTALTGIECAASDCKSAPTITTPKVAISSPTSMTITWETECPSDARVYWGTDTGFGNGTGLFDLSGALTHSATINDLWPGYGYKFAISSRAIKSGKAISQPAFYVAGDIKMPPAESGGDFDYFVDVQGPHHVVQGFATYILVRAGFISGTDRFEKGTYKVSVRNLPPHTSVGWPDEEHDEATVRAHGIPIGSAGTTTLWSPVNTQIELVTNVGGVTPQGTYTINIVTTTATAGHGKGPSKQTPWRITVEGRPTFAAASPKEYPAIPEFATWKSWMTKYGKKWCGQTKFDYESVAFYDGERVYLQIGDYTHDSVAWNVCAANAELAYRDGVVIPNNGAVTGFSVFPEGLYMDYLRSGDTASRDAIHMLATRAAGAVLKSGALALIDARNIRETAFLLNANRIDSKLGKDRTRQSSQLVAILLGDIDQIAISHTAIWHQPFMDGLAAEALIAYYEDGHKDDVRIPAAIQRLADYLWAECWNRSDYEAGAFYYNSYHYSMGMPLGANEMKGLNLLIAPMYAWLYKMTGDPKYQIEGDEIFRKAFTANPGDTVGWSGKNFSQNYRWSFDYIKWRGRPQSASQSTKQLTDVLPIPPHR